MLNIGVWQRKAKYTSFAVKFQEPSSLDCLTDAEEKLKRCPSLVHVITCL